MHNQKPTSVYGLEQRQLLSGAIRGALPGSVKVAKYASLVRDCLLNWSISLDRQSINMQIKRATNNQDLFRAVHLVLDAERPGLVDDLFNGQKNLLTGVETADLAA